MKQFGWVNFLKTLALTKVWDLPGMNSIDSVRESPAFDVLILASEDKLYSESEYIDYKANT